MNTKSIKRIAVVLLAFLMLTAFAVACIKDKDKDGSDVGELFKPTNVLINQDANFSKVVTVGGQIALEQTHNYQGDAKTSFETEWTVNGTKQSQTQSTLNLETKEVGEYTVTAKVIAYSGNGDKRQYGEWSDTVTATITVMTAIDHFLYNYQYLVKLTQAEIDDYDDQQFVLVLDDVTKSFVEYLLLILTNPDNQKLLEWGSNMPNAMDLIMTEATNRLQPETMDAMTVIDDLSIQLDDKIKNIEDGLSQTNPNKQTMQQQLDEARALLTQIEQKFGEFDIDNLPPIDRYVMENGKANLIIYQAELEGLQESISQLD